MKITFPHFGNAHIPARIFLTEIGVEVILPPLYNSKTLEEGAKLSPEDICIPFKLMIAGLVECYKQGADTVIMPATMGPCRLGEYAELLKSILDANGYKMDWILIDAVSDIGGKELINRLSKVVSQRNTTRMGVAKAAKGAYKIIKGLDGLEEAAYRYAAYEIVSGQHKEILVKTRALLSMATNTKDGVRIISGMQELMDKIPLNTKLKPIRLMVTGEIFSLIEPMASHNLFERLMDMRVSFSKRMYIGWWIDHTILNPFYGKYMERKKNKYLGHMIGGYAKETVEDGIICARRGYDGMIQIFPSGCMPEIVAKSAFGPLVEDLKIKVLTLIFDEMDGDAGYITRLEAFLDILEIQKKRKSKLEGRKKNVLSWN